MGIMDYRLEDDECFDLVVYLNFLKQMNKVVKFAHIPNETYTQSWKIKNRNKALGVSSGVPDYLIVFKGKTIFIEMKRVKGGTCSTAQKEWIEALNSAGIDSYIAKGFKEAEQIIKKYI